MEKVASVPGNPVHSVVSSEAVDTREEKDNLQGLQRLLCLQKKTLAGGVNEQASKGGAVVVVA